MGTPTVALQPKDPTGPVQGPAGELLQPVSVKAYPIRLRPPTQAAIEAGKGYISISFYEAGRRKNTSGGYTLDEALVTVQEIIETISSGAINAPHLMGELIDRYLDPDRVQLNKEPWSAKHRYNQERLARLYVRPAMGAVRCKDISKADIQRAINSAPTKGEGQRVRILLGSLIRYGIDQDYIGKPIESLMKNLLWEAKGRVMPEPKRKVQGATKLTVDKQDIPKLNDVYALAHALKSREDVPWWWEMMVIFSAFTGLRLGELLGLPASDVALPPSCKVEVQRQFLELNQQFDLPKGNKVRSTRYPKVTPPGEHYPQGYPLGEMVRKRKQEVDEQFSNWPADEPGPTERDGLMFPAPRGGPWSQSNFTKRRLTPARQTAGWPLDRKGRQRWTWHNLRHFFATYNLQERTMPAAFVSDAMGHSSVSITIDCYQNIAEDSWTRLYSD